jgi:hypothetical protein
MKIFPPAYSDRVSLNSKTAPLSRRRTFFIRPVIHRDDAPKKRKSAPPGGGNSSQLRPAGRIFTIQARAGNSPGFPANSPCREGDCWWPPGCRREAINQHPQLISPNFSYINKSAKILTGRLWVMMILFNSGSKRYYLSQTRHSLHWSERHVFSG